MRKLMKILTNYRNIKRLQCNKDMADMNSTPDEQATYVYKIVLIGDGKVGKTSLRRNYMGQGFQKEYYKTLKADIAYYPQPLDDFLIKYSIWDLAGQPEFDNVRIQYYAGASGAILVFDVTERDSFENLTKWVKQLISSTESQGTPIVLAANKMDLYQENEHIDFDEVDAKIEEIRDKFDYPYPIDLITTSALTGENVEKAFVHLGRIIYDWKINKVEY
jgi:small GTP-binding protein